MSLLSDKLSGPGSAGSLRRLLTLNKRLTRIVVFVAVALVIGVLVLIHDRSSNTIRLPDDVYAAGALGSLASFAPSFLRGPEPVRHYPFSTTSYFRPVSVENPNSKSKDDLQSQDRSSTR